MSEMSGKIVEQEVKIAGLKRKVLALTVAIVIMLLLLLIYLLLKVNWKQIGVPNFFNRSQ